MQLSLISALWCSKCKGGGALLPEIGDSSWKCANCAKIYPSSHEENVLSLLDDVMKGKLPLNERQITIYSLDNGEKSNEDLVTRCERLIFDHSAKTVHPNHKSMIDLNCILARAYGSEEGYQLKQLTKTQLQRKIQLCNQVRMACLCTVVQ